MSSYFSFRRVRGLGGGILILLLDLVEGITGTLITGSLTLDAFAIARGVHNVPFKTRQKPQALFPQMLTC